MNIEAMADSIFVAVRDYCTVELDRRIVELRKEFASERDERYLSMTRGIEHRLTAVPAGPQGEPGPAGKDGVDGKDGANGIDGKDGISGVDGKDGAPGIDGKDGATGIDGKDGANGIDGKDGALGRDGADGKAGEPGIDGKDGMRGFDGKDGAPGIAGKDGRDGVDGKDGAIGVKGEDGRDGRDGKEGAPGRDALRLDVLDEIEEQRSYARGTYAQHKGGLLRAFRTTDPITEDVDKSGWQIVMDGINEAQLDGNVDERFTKVLLVFTSGKQVEHVMRWPVMIYRGVWTDGAYEHGDTCTRDGSLWHCERATTGKPGESADWKLATKRGRDGKEGPAGPEGKEGPEGKPGRDFTKLGAK